MFIRPWPCVCVGLLSLAATGAVGRINLLLTIGADDMFCAKSLRCDVAVFLFSVLPCDVATYETWSIKVPSFFYIMPMGLACKEFTSNCLYQFPMYWIVTFHVIFKGIMIQSLCQPAFVGQFIFVFVLANLHQLLTCKDTLKSCVCVMLMFISISSRYIIMKLMANWCPWSPDCKLHWAVLF